MTHLAAPVGVGLPSTPDATGESGSAACGDLVRLGLVIADGRVATVGFLAFGCPAATAAASAACARLEGASLDEALALSADQLDRDLGGLGPDRRHGPEIAVDALARALEGWYSARLGEAGPEADPGRVAVAMSGGVDSAVAAQELVAAGYDVVGVTMRLWHDPAAAAAERSCCSPETVQQARACAHHIRIPHLTLDVIERFRRGVVAEFIAGYEGGTTPNPCITCNGSVRFSVLAEAAALLGAGRVASGHYARLAEGIAGPVLAAARDGAKDQSYMLAELGAALRRRMILPLGELTKDEVRRRAREAALPAADAVESQEVCFVGVGGYGPFLERNSDLEPRVGDIIDGEGNVLGTHRGYWNYTVGQRRGLGLAARAPLYVLATDAEANTVTVGPREALATHQLSLAPARIHDDIDGPLEIRVRYRGRALPGRLDVADGGGIVVSLDEPADGVAPGQTAAAYREGRLVAAGRVARAGEEA